MAWIRVRDNFREGHGDWEYQWLGFQPSDAVLHEMQCDRKTEKERYFEGGYRGSDIEVVHVNAVPLSVIRDRIAVAERVIAAQQTVRKQMFDQLLLRQIVEFDRGECN